MLSLAPAVLAQVDVLADVPLPAVAALCGVAGAALARGGLHYAQRSVRSQLLGRTVWRIAPGHGEAFLTFDDGPGKDTERILDVLGEHGATATFFCVGQRVRERPAVARRIVAEGHELGNHSFTHPFYPDMPEPRLLVELERAQDAIADVTGVRPRLARPPYGARSRAYFRAARRLGLVTVQWDCSGEDWLDDRTGDAIAAAILRDARDGSIILLHDADSLAIRSRAATADALPALVDGLRARGLRPGRLAARLGVAEAPDAGAVPA